jgi:hypothetical protein
MIWDVLKAIQQTADGGYILGGYSNSNISGDKSENCRGNDDFWIVKTDSTGNIEWQNTIGGINLDDQLYVFIQQTMMEDIFWGIFHFNISPEIKQKIV